jgi:hypothetical protein
MLDGPIRDRVDLRWPGVESALGDLSPAGCLKSRGESGERGQITSGDWPLRELDE